jgi:hypothetical protein
MDQLRDPPAPFSRRGAVTQVGRLRRDNPVSGVRAPRRSYGYALVAPPWIRGCRVRNATRQGPSAAS